MEKKFLSVQDVALIAMLTAVITICSWISIPIGPVPFTLQTFAVFVAGGLLGTKRGVITVLTYILLGLVGVPVFSNFGGGPGVLAGPTGGFIIGFLFTVVIIGTLPLAFSNSKEWIKNGTLILAMIIGDAGCFALGTAWFVFVMKSTVVQALGWCVIPYIIPDLLKILLAVWVVNRLKKYVH